MPCIAESTPSAEFVKYITDLLLSVLDVFLILIAAPAQLLRAVSVLDSDISNCPVDVMRSLSSPAVKKRRISPL